jgi:hypothetical protein
MSRNNELAEIALTSDRSVAQNSSNSNASSSTPFFLTPTGLLIRKLVAEFVGVMLMVILIGYVVNAVGNPSMRTARTDSTQSFSAALVCYSLVYGLAVATLMGMLAHISGGYFNPALVIGCYAIGSFDGSVFHAIFYILAQMAGSVVGASWLLLLPFPTSVLTTLSFVFVMYLPHVVQPLRYPSHCRALKSPMALPSAANFSPPSSLPSRGSQSARMFVCVTPYPSSSARWLLATY